MKFLKHTNITLREVGDLLRKKLQDELKFQKHNATGRLSRGLKYNVIKKGLSILNVTSSVAYWKAVNNPAFAKIPNLNTIVRWMGQRNIRGGMSVAMRILGRIKTSGYGNRNYPDNSMRDAYVVYQEGNATPRRTNFAGYVADKHSKEVAAKLAPSIGVDVANMISDQIKKNNPKTNVTRAF
jgi:hypothetical protein